MLFGNADIEQTIGETIAENIKACSGGHSRCDGNDLIVFFSFFNERFSKHACVRGGGIFRFILCACDNVKARHAVHFIGGCLCWSIAASFLCNDMNKYRATLRIVAYILKNRDKMLEIVAINGADIIETHFLKQRAASDQAACVVFGFAGSLFEGAWKNVREFLGDVTDAPILLGRGQP